MIKIITISNIDSFAAKLKSDTPKPRNIQSIISDVRQNGDSAIKKYERKFGAKIHSLKVSQKEIKDAYDHISKTELAAIKELKKCLEYSEKIIKSKLGDFIIRNNGIKILKSFEPLDDIGCYVPGGLARYPSSAVMSVVPAKVAGVRRIVLVSPPDKHGKIDPLVLVAANMCGATEIYKTGGAQAIAALSYGTATIKPVDKIVGPGSSFVTTAKLLTSHSSAIDMLAGPTELAIIADDSSNIRYITSDLISQAEHSENTTCYVITDSAKMAKKIDQALDKKIKTIQRDKIVQSSLEKNGFIAICKTKNDMIYLANKLAPEHLQILGKNPQKMADKIKTPGLVLIGENTPSSASDYLLGSNHILPTCRFGRTRGSLSVLDFLKLGTKIMASKNDLRRISKHIKTLSHSEGLPNHYLALEARL